MATQTARFTKAFLAKIPLSPNKKPHIYADRVVRGLKLKANMTRKTFLLEKRIRGRRGSAVTFKLGTFPHLSLEDARKIARRYISFCERGYDPRLVDQPDNGRQRVPLSAAIETRAPNPQGLSLDYPSLSQGLAFERSL